MPPNNGIELTGQERHSLCKREEQRERHSYSASSCLSLERMPTVSARVRKDRAPLTEGGMLAVLRTTLPKRNGFVAPNTAELLGEARRFGITSRRKLRHLLLRHRRQLIAEDRAALYEEPYMNHIRADLGPDYAAEMRRKQRCFAWEALVRNAFELEFGEAYERFANRRDAL